MKIPQIILLFLICLSPLSGYASDTVHWTELQQVDAFIDELTVNLDAKSRYITELKTLLGRCKSVAEFEQEIAEHGRGKRWVTQENWDSMSLEERVRSCLITNETWLFRFDEAELRFIQIEILPFLKQTKARTLSLPSSRGDEALTFAYLYQGAGLEDFQILGLDRSEEMVEQASLRSREGKGSIQFRQADIFSEAFKNSEEEFDLIICRHFLAYFEPAKIRDLLELLESKLADDGFLILERYVVQRYPELFQSFSMSQVAENVPVFFKGQAYTKLDRNEARKKFSNNYVSHTQLSGRYVTVNAKKVVVPSPQNQIVKDFNQVWTKDAFLEPRVPFSIGRVEDPYLFDLYGVPPCIHMPIKLPGSDIRLPAEYEQFKDVIQAMIDHEYSTNPNFDSPYFYLTIDQGFVPAGKSQRLPFAHVDGIPRERSKITQITDHAYVVSNAIPTKYYLHPFDFSAYDLNTHNFFEIMNRTADERFAMYTTPYQIYLMGPYNVHTATVTDKDVVRTFLRLEMSELDFDREGNTVNPAFVEEGRKDYPFVLRPRPIPSHLVVPDELKTAEELANSNAASFEEQWYGEKVDLEESR